MNKARPFVVAVTLVMASCSGEEIVPERNQPSNAWDAYRAGLQDAGLGGTALGTEWRRVADAALDTPVDAELPYVERGRFDSRQAHAFGYRFTVARGQRVEIHLRLDGPSPTVFMDLFRAVADAPRLHVASADAESRQLVFEPRRDAEYLLRLQPELLRGGQYELEIGIEASLGFPVAGHGVNDIWSVFGAERDAGRRSHNGIDIFAPRGTPAVAATRAYVRRVREQSLGGLTVWLFDQERQLHLYYAHLNEQLVEPGTWVEAGQIVGRVGNTGNARTTAPHLHFAIYAAGAGPVNPDPYLRQPTRSARTIRASTDLLGVFAEADDATALRAGLRGSSAADLPMGTPMRIWAAAADSYRVALVDGRVGFVDARHVRLATASDND